MKTSKRILGIALAVIMIFNVFAVGAFAMPDNCVVDLIIDTDKDVYAPGETITLKISTQAIADVDMMTIGGQFEIAYPSAVVAPKATTTVLEDHGFVAIAPGYDAGISGVSIPSESSGAVVPGTDATIRYNVADNGTAFSASAAPVELFTVQMVIAADAAFGTYTIGFNQAGYDEYAAFSNDGIGLGGLYGNIGADYGFAQEYMYNCGSVTFTIGAGKIIFHEKAQHNTKLTTSDVATLGFVGNFDKNDIGGFTFVAGSTTTLANVTAVGVTLDIAGIGSQTKTTDALYLKSGSVYNFRAILKDLDLAQYGDAKITATYFVTFLKDGTPTTEYSDPVEFTANGIING